MSLAKTLFWVWPLLLAVANNPAAQDKPAAIPRASPIGNKALPSWEQLSKARQQALAPLRDDWNALEPDRKKKWLAIGDKFDTMNPEQQARAQSRMREWVAIKPEQRRLARESYLQSKQLKPEQKTAKWERYQQLSDDEKQKLAASASQKKRLATLPALHTAPGYPVRPPAAALDTNP